MRSGIGNSPQDPFFTSTVGAGGATAPAGSTNDPLTVTGRGQMASANSQSVVPASDTSPFPVSGTYSSTMPTVTSGQRVDLQTNQRGVLLFQLADQFNQTIGFANGSADAQAASANGLQTNSRGQVFNGTSWDRQRGDTSGVFIGANQFWTESTSALAASVTLNGTLRANGGAAGGIGSRFAFFIAEAFSDVAGGTLFIDKTVDGGTTYRQVGSIALVANSSVSLKVPISAPGYRARVVNGSTAQTAALVTSAYSLN